MKTDTQCHPERNEVESKDLMKDSRVRVIGGGLAGCEAALQLASRGFKVDLYEMRPVRQTPAHKDGHLAQLVCSNSFKALGITSAIQEETSEQGEFRF